MVRDGGITKRAPETDASHTPAPGPDCQRGSMSSEAVSTRDLDHKLQ